MGARPYRTGVWRHDAWCYLAFLVQNSERFTAPGRDGSRMNATQARSMHRGGADTWLAHPSLHSVIDAM